MINAMARRQSAAVRVSVPLPPIHWASGSAATHMATAPTIPSATTGTRATTSSRPMERWFPFVMSAGTLNSRPVSTPRPATPARSVTTATLTKNTPEPAAPRPRVTTMIRRKAKTPLMAAPAIPAAVHRPSLVDPPPCVTGGSR